MKTKNFPAKKDARRRSALVRICALPPHKYASVQMKRDADVLSLHTSISEGARDVRTKKARNSRAAS